MRVRAVRLVLFAIVLILMFATPAQALVNTEIIVLPNPVVHHHQAFIDFDVWCTAPASATMTVILAQNHTATRTVSFTCGVDSMEMVEEFTFHGFHAGAATVLASITVCDLDTGADCTTLSYTDPFPITLTAV